jgi:hypothetical protein
VAGGGESRCTHLAASSRTAEPQNVNDAVLDPEPCCGHWCPEGVLGFVVVDGVVVVDGTVVVVGVDAEPLPTAAMAAPPPATSAPHATSARTNRLAEIMASFPLDCPAIEPAVS